MARRFEPYSTRMKKGVVAEWLNAADSNFVPLWYVGSNPSHPKWKWKNRVMIIWKKDKNDKSRSK